MTDDSLLAFPDWDRFSDKDLRRAVTLAKIQGRKTYALLAARSEEQGTKIPPPSLDLYARHCVLTLPNGKDLWNRWNGLRIVDLIGDPRLYWFCTLYDQRYRKHLNLGPLSRSIPLLKARASHACSQFEKVRSTLAIKAFLASLPKGQTSPQALEEMQQLHDAALDFSMLCLMEIHARMDTFISR